jgi:hypothetical protein
MRFGARRIVKEAKRNPAGKKSPLCLVACTGPCGCGRELIGTLRLAGFYQVTCHDMTLAPPNVRTHQGIAGLAHRAQQTRCFAWLVGAAIESGEFIGDVDVARVGFMCASHQIARACAIADRATAHGHRVLVSGRQISCNAFSAGHAVAIEQPMSTKSMIILGEQAAQGGKQVVFQAIIEYVCAP